MGITRNEPRDDPETSSGFGPDVGDVGLWQDRGMATTAADTSRPTLMRLERARSLGGDGRIVAGVAATVSSTLGVDPLVTRLCFVVLAVAGGWGVLLYAAVWVWFALGPVPAGHPEALDRTDALSRDVGVAVVTLGLVLAARDLEVGFVDALVWPIALVAVGLALAWRRVGDIEAAGWLPRAVLGAAVVLLGSIPLVGSDLTLAAWVRTFGGLAVVLTGVVVIFAPALRTLASQLVEERQRRIRSDERSVISSHLHDSVLQTLALIQKRAADPAEVATLARQQERELRAWLYEGDRAGAGTFRAAVMGATADVEELYRTPIECIVVGDLALDPRLTALVAAGREAAVNAAKFSGAATIDVYAEVGPTAVELFVRDRGVGFDAGSVASDRRGIADSIIARVERVGGTAEIRTGPGEGTEIRLRLPLDTATPA